MINPTAPISVSFDEYVRSRESALQAHTEQGIPDYAFGSDYAIRKRLRAIPVLYRFCKVYASYIVPRQKKICELTSIRVSPKQYPEIYQITEHCAKTLGIGIPDLYIEPNLMEINARTYATDEDSPLIVLHSALVERLTPEELCFVIGHECGHIHNLHGIYDIAAQILINSGTIAGVKGGLPVNLLPLLNLSTSMALNMWSRAAEVTCDRAGLICCGNFEVAQSTFAKFLSGGLLNNDAQASLEELTRQYEGIRRSPIKLLELDFNHPTSIRRILAAREFMNSAVYYDWHPEQKTAGRALLNHEELDALCNEYISVTKGKGGKKSDG